jgi:AraC family transcriptional regulator
MREARRRPADFDDVFAGSRRIKLDWPGLAVEYAWLPPFEGAGQTTPNTLQIVFSSNAGVAMEYDRIVHDLTVAAGGLYVVGSEPTTLLNVREHSEVLKMHVDMSLLRSAAGQANIRHFELEPSLRGQRSVTLSRDPVMLGVGHVLRRACMSQVALSDIEANHLAHLLVQRVLLVQHGTDARRFEPAARLSDEAIRRAFDFIETNLERTITLDDLASRAGLSPFHFARCFKNSTGLAPHQYVLARRIDLAKRRVVTSKTPVQEIGWSVGFENISHFRRQFASQIGIVPGDLRKAVFVPHRSARKQ